MVDEDLLGGTANPTSVESIAASLQKVINLLQEGQFEVVHKFREQVYEPVRNKTVQVIDRTKEDS